jgi:predicted Rossmann fold nucleotide-binding protein DprA/Smf involved in DNA uptake
VPIGEIMISSRVEDLPPSKRLVYRSVVAALESEPLSCKALSGKVGIPVPALSRILVDLEKAGILADSPPYSRIPRIWRIQDIDKAKVLD